MDFVSATFCPLIAVAASPDVLDVLKKNNISSLSHLFEPFASPLFTPGSYLSLDADPFTYSSQRQRS